MSADEELLAAVQHVRDRTGDPNAWQMGLTPREVAAVISPTTPPEQLGAIVNKIRQRSESSAPAAASDREQGDAAEAIAVAEAALAQQNSASSQLDMQVISAILNAHLNTVEGRQALSKLQRETEAAVHTRSDLDTPAGARDFQRFLIGKLRDIRGVVLNGNLDDTSKSTLMAAWTSLYDASKSEPTGSDEHPFAAAGGPDATAQEPMDDDSGWDPLLDSLLVDDPGVLAGEAAGPDPTARVAASAVPIPPMPSFGGESLPGLGAVPGSLAGWGAPGGFPLSDLRGYDETDPAFDDGPLDSDAAKPTASDEPEGHEGGSHTNDDGEETTGAGESPAQGPTPVTLPDGETVTAASPQLAAAITAAVGGSPIAEAFRQQGITIPPPGTAVADPVDPGQVTPGDIGIFIDRHALALGPDKALLDGQIQHIATVSGPSFLGWEHPPAASAPLAAPAEPKTPTPTRPASSSAS